MKFKSQVYTQASGSVGGVTYARNAAGMYARARSIPVNPNSAFQQAVRSLFSVVGNAWQSVLTAAQRAAWEVYANNVPIVDSLGDSLKLSGVAMYTRCNVARLQAGLARVDAGPTTFAAGPADPTLAGTVSAATQLLTLTFNDELPWCDQAGAALLVYISRPTASTINYFKGPYRFADAILGAAVSPPESTQTISVPFAVTAGQVVHVRCLVVGADGRIGPDFLFRSTIAA